MATIKPNENAPAEDVRYLLANEELVLAPGGSTDTEDRLVLAAALEHPWLEVEYDAAAFEAPPSYDPHVPRSEDPLTYENSEALKSPGTAAVQEDVQPVAIDAGLDQTKAVEEGGVAKTLAADETDTDTAPAKRAKRS